MNNLSWKKIAIGVVSVAIIAVGIFYFTTSQGKKQTTTSVNPAFGEYITSYTAGVLNSGSALRIILAQDVVDSTLIGRESDTKLFDFSPGVPGKTVWLDAHTVEFRPAARMISGQVYEVGFQLSKLLDVPSDLSVFHYTFQIIPQNFELTVDNIKPYVKTELKRQKIEGVLLTADFAEDNSIEGTMVAKQDGKALKISWSHAGEGKQHSFLIEDVVRGESASKVDIEVDGNKLGIDQRDNREVEIPALGDFKVTNVKVEQSSNQHVVIQFSDPLSEKQNIQGLIAITDLSSLDFEVKDNEIKVFPAVRQTGTKTMTIHAGIKNILNYSMKEEGTWDVTFEQANPAVRFVGKGSILPATDGLIMPFEAVNLKAVDVEIVKVFENNVLQFFQTNNYEGAAELRRVGKPVLKKMISLENSGVTDLGKWNRFTLDLSTLINTEPGAIYQVRINIKKAYAVFDCASDGETADGNLAALGDDEWSEPSEEFSYWDSYEDYYYDDDYDWNERENPCHSSYYTGNRNIKKNVIASDLGLLAKRGGDGNTVIFVNDLKTTKPMSGIALELYDFQQQIIGTASTDGDGKAVIRSKSQPFMVLAKSGAQRGYLKMGGGGESLSLSNFDISGERVEKGLKGFLYGERGVWRPGDSLFLTFMLEDKMKLLPANHPVVFELQNPQGQVTNRIVRASGENGFYKFATATSPDAPTGNWTGRIKVGGTDFTQTIKIETIKPNRLKVNLDFGVDRIAAGANNLTGKLNVKWLHGAPGKNLKTQYEVTLTKGETKFARYPDFAFDDPSRDFSSEALTIFDDFTDADGNATVNATLATSETAPGVLNAVFRGKAFEESGNFSVDRFSLPYYPFESFTGIRLPQGDKARGMLLTDTTHRVDIVTLDADGKPVSRDNLDMTIYKLSWRWWWDENGDNANYISSSASQVMASGKARTVNGKGSWDFKIKYPEWGRYFVKACDPVSGHCTGEVVYIDWPGWAGRARGEADGATMLSFSTDKTAYAIGEKASVVIPGAEGGRALVSIENGSRVIQSYWVETTKGDNPFSFDITKEMTPNVFVHITMIQPHSQTTNDLPIRLYGVVPVKVEDPDTHLQPVIEMPDVLEPGQEVTIKISEKTKKKMTYTLAVVDEGLLDITRFKTPDAWNRFYAREALGVRTWDIYDQVMGAFGGKIERLLALGGDMEAATKEDDAKANRFKPVVKFLGPFTIDGGSKSHTFTMPQYIGSVKTMVVAGYEGAYGLADKATPVRKPLMVLATLPRVLGPEEKLKLPVTLFSMEKSIRQVKVEVKASGPLQLPVASQQVTMTGSDMTVEFDLAVKSLIGLGKIEVTATSGNYRATDVIEIDIRNPNPPVSNATAFLLEAGKSWSGDVTAVGMAGTNSAVLEVSSIPPINLGQRLKYLMMYPHGCIEQTTSSVFPQLYLDQVKVLTDGEKNLVQTNVKAGIERLKLFVTRDGGFAYWPGGQDSESWASTYAGHFLVEADAKGYVVPRDMLRKWKKYQREKAQNWRKSQEYASSELIQAYRLYALALAGDADLGSMNRLREQSNLPTTAIWMLAAAYVKAGQPEAAKKMIATASTIVKPYQELDYSYGSDMRDKAIILETLVLLGERGKGFELLKDISNSLSSESYWMSTQAVAWCLKAAGAFASTEKRGPLKFTYTYKGKEVTASTELPLAQVPLAYDGATGGRLTVVSQSQGALFARLITTGTPARGREEEGESNLNISVTYTDTDGNAIDPTNLEQGTEFIASVSVLNPGNRGEYKNLALNQIFPSGWEINNLRLDDAEARLTSDKPTYQDIRDDRVYTYFDLNISQRKTFKILLTASYAGTYYLPAVSCEAMYDHSIYARKKGTEVSVSKAGVQ